MVREVISTAVFTVRPERAFAICAEIAKAREGILNLRGDPVLGLYAREWTRGTELRDRLRQIENAIKAEGKEKKPDKERLAQLEQLRGETLTAFHRLYHPQFARDAR